MNKQDLVEALSTRMHKSQREASETIDTLLDEIKRALAKGESIRISGFGAFEQTVRSARLGRNPRTGEPVTIAATRVVRFRPAADFKAIVAGTRRAVASAVGQGTSPTEEPSEAAPAAKKAAAKKAPAKKAPAKKAAVKKAPAKKAPAKKAAAKKATTASKSTAKKATTASKSTAKKATAASKSTAKKATTASKSTAKKATTAATSSAAKPSSD